MNLEKLNLLIAHSDSMSCVIVSKNEAHQTTYDEDKMLKEIHTEIMEVVKEKEEEKTVTTDTKEVTFSNGDIPF